MIALVKLNWVDLGTKLEVRQCHGHLVETFSPLHNLSKWLFMV